MNSRKWMICTVLATILFNGPWAPAQTVSDSDFISIEAKSVPLNKDTTFSLLIGYTHATPTTSIVLPLRFAGNPNLFIDTGVVTGGAIGVTFEGSGLDTVWAFRNTVVDQGSKTILIGFVSLSGVLPPSNGPLVRIHFRLQASAQQDVLTVDSTWIAPANRLTITDATSFPHTPQFEPGTICQGLPVPGDIDGNGTVNAADIVFLVNYVFKSGLVPVIPCF